MCSIGRMNFGRTVQLAPTPWRSFGISAVFARGLFACFLFLQTHHTFWTQDQSDNALLCNQLQHILLLNICVRWVLSPQRTVARGNSLECCHETMPPDTILQSPKRELCRTELTLLTFLEFFLAWTRFPSCSMHEDTKTGIASDAWSQ
jgi:hypothetical protein